MQVSFGLDIGKPAVYRVDPAKKATDPEYPIIIEYQRTCC